MIATPTFYSESDPQFQARLKLRAVSFEYDPKLPVIQDCSALLPASGTFRVVGSTGSGVSTLMRLMAGLLSCVRGEIHWGDFSVDSHALMTDPKWRLSYAYVQRTGGLLANQDLLSNAIFPLLYHGWCQEEKARILAMEYFRQAGIAEEATRLPAWCSVSARKASLLIRALLPQPSLLIADEPVDGMDAEMAAAIGKLIAWHRQKKGLRLVVVGSHHSGWDETLNMKTIDFKDGRFAEDSRW